MTIRCTSVSLSVTATALIFCLSVWIPAGRIRLRQQTLPAPVGLDWFILNSVCTTAVLAFLSIPGRFSRTSDWRGARVWKDSTSLTASTALGSQEAAIFVVTWWLITGWPGFWSRQRHWCCWFSPARCEAAHAWRYCTFKERIASAGALRCWAMGWDQTAGMHRRYLLVKYRATLTWSQLLLHIKSDGAAAARTHRDRICCYWWRWIIITHLMAVITEQILPYTDTSNVFKTAQMTNGGISVSAFTCV